MHTTPDTPTAKVTTLELFFDLVFVFSITQITGLVVKAQGLGDFYKTFMVLALVWWMYAGYVWLTNNVNFRKTGSRLFLMLGMTGFLMMALAVPKVFSEGGLLFGLGYLLVVFVHTSLFTRADNPSSARAIWNIAPYNFGAAGLVLLAGLINTSWDWVWWTSAIGVLVFSTTRRSEQAFAIGPSHFAERHGLVVLIVLGESIVAIGAGAADEPMGIPLVLAAVLGLMLTGALWWVYFDHDDIRAEHALAAAQGNDRARLAGYGYFLAHLFIIAGVVTMAAGNKQVIAHLSEVYPASAWNLGVGVALFMLGQVLFRRNLGIDQGFSRWIMVGLALLTVVVGLTFGGLVQMVILLVLLVGMLVFEQDQ